MELAAPAVIQQGIDMVHPDTFAVCGNSVGGQVFKYKA
jgi:hypothetical protein